MQLNNSGLMDTASFQRAGYRLPSFDRKAMTEKTLEAPAWITLAQETSSVPSRQISCRASLTKDFLIPD